MDDLGNGTWCGKKLEDMSREELYAAMQSIDNLRHADREQHEADLEMLEPAPLKKPWIATRARSQRITARQSLQLGDIAELVPARLRLVAVLSLLVCTENLNPNVVMVKFTKYRM